MSFLDRDALVAANLIDVTAPGDSYLIERIENESMPPLEQRQRDPVVSEELASLKAWLQAGAPPFPDENARRPFFSTEDMLRAVRDYLRDKDPADRPFFRFFTLHHLFNNSRIDESDLRLHRAALSKALNSLSWSTEVFLPEMLAQSGAEDRPGSGDGALGVVLAVDLRRILGPDNQDWAATGRWEILVRSYPYGISFRDLVGDSRARLQKEIEELLQAPGNRNPLDRVVLPILRADWFVATAVRPPLYHTLLGVPATARELEERLDVDLATSFGAPEDRRLARAGFSKSGVSGQNRLVERVSTPYGAYWRSYDFLPSTKRGNLRRFPLGPVNMFPKGKHPFPDQAFVNDGGEIIFSLPNGLQGYMLVDGDNRRIDIGAIELVSDALKTAGTPAIVNGVSCMACHAQGIVEFTDELANNNAIFGEPAKAVARLFPPPAQMKRLMDGDRARFRSALEAATAPFLQRGLDADRPVVKYGDPIGELARTYRLIYLDATTIACEVDAPNAEEVVQSLGQRRMKELGLEHALLRGGVISRGEWEASDGRSLMQDVASELGMTPIQ